MNRPADVINVSEIGTGFARPDVPDATEFGQLLVRLCTQYLSDNEALLAASFANGLAIFAPNDLSIGSERRIGDSLYSRSRCHSSKRKGDIPFSVHIKQCTRINPCRSGDGCAMLKTKRRTILIKCRSDICQYKFYCYLSTGVQLGNIWNF